MATRKQKFDIQPVVQAALPVAAAIVLLGALATGLSWVWRVNQTNRAMTRADSLLQKGLAALAADTLEPYRGQITLNDKNCQVLVAVYYQSRRAERLESSGQACLEAGIESAEVYLGLAGAREIMGRDAEAIQLLMTGAQKFEKNPLFHVNLAQLLRRNKRDAEATTAFRRAMDLSPQDSQLALDALQYFLTLKSGEDVKFAAQKLKTVQSDNPEVKLFVARALVQTGDTGDAKPLIAQAREQLAKKPEVKAVLEKSYADVLAIQ